MPVPEKPEIIQEHAYSIQVSLAEKSALLSVIKSDEYQTYLSEISKKPDKLAPDWVYDNIDEVAKNCRKIYFMYLGLLSYSLLTAVTTSDRHLILGQNVQLPVIGTTVPVHLFFILTPILAIGLFVYIQLYLLKVNKLIKFAVEKCFEINRINPKCFKKTGDECSIHNICDEHENRLYPWMIIFSKYSKEKFTGKLQRLFTKFSLWLLLPIVLMVFSLLIVKKHELTLSYLLLFLTLLGTGIVFAFWHKSQYSEISPPAVQTRVSKGMNSILWFLFHHRKTGNQGKIGRKLQGIRTFIGGFILLFTVFFFAILLLIIIDKTNEGTLWAKDGSWSDEVDFRTRYLREMVLVDLSQKILIGETEIDQKSDLLYWLDLEDVHLEGANLASTILTKANLKKSNLKNANLIGATLDHAALDLANLNLAKLSAASLKGASLYGVQLRGSDLVRANLRGANLSYANLQGANLASTNLNGTTLFEANLFLANFRGAEDISKDQIMEAANWKLGFYSEEIVKSLKLPKNHNKKIKKKDFRGYVLKRANLKEANLQEADLSEANLQQADLRGANLKEANLRKTILKDANLQSTVLYKTKGITKEQLFNSINFKLALYSKEWLKKLDLPSNHNRRIKEKNLDSYNLQKVNLKMADLSEANLRNANLWGVNLSEADLRGANLNEAYLKDADLWGVNLQDANLRGANLAYADLQYADLRRAKGISKDLLSRTKNYKIAYYSQDSLNILELPPDHNDRVKKKNFGGYDFQGANLQNAELLEANFKKANLQNANLWKASLQKANLPKACLIGANLKYANLRGANLEGADLRGADLRGANLLEANLQEADLRGANLAFANLQYTDLRQAIGISKDLMNSAYNYKLAFYSEASIESLKLLPDHNDRVIDSDFQGYDFEGANIKKADLLEANLRNANLKNADLRETSLLNADLQSADLRQAIGISKDGLENASNWKLAFYSPSICESLGLLKDHNKRVKEKNFKDYVFTKASLKGADLRGANLQNADLNEADLQRADLRGAKNLRKNQLLSAKNYKLAFYSNYWLKKLELPLDHHKRMIDKDLKRYRLQGANLQGADLNGANLQETILEDAKLQATKLKEADLRAANLQKAILKKADLTEANLEDAELQEAKLNGAELFNANLWRAKLTGADLTDTNLKDAKLKKANFINANLENADLYGADLREAKLEGAIFRGADLRDILYTDYDQFAKVATLYQTKLNESLMTQLESKYPSLFKKPVF